MTGLGHQARLTWSVSHVLWGGYEITPCSLIRVLSVLISFILVKLLLHQVQPWETLGQIVHMR